MRTSNNYIVQIIVLPWDLCVNLNVKGHVSHVKTIYVAQDVHLYN